MGASGGMRFNDGKVKWSLVDFEALESMVRVLEYGTHKYSIFADEHGDQFTGKEVTPEQASLMTLILSGRDNWKKGLKVTGVMESLMRHAIAILNGEMIDSESGLEHIGHLMCNAMFAAHLIKHLPEFNDLPKKD